jgi:DNA (cytosine-5)-methyltransferase 1
MTLTAVSLFAGVGGFDLALERNGVQVVAAVEIDNNARGVLAHRFPNTQLFTDVCEVSGGQLIAAGFVPERGIITGGFPCQDLSVAGKRAGLDGARSGLFWEICRLLDETKAKWFILENVPGLLSSNGGRDMGAVVGALAERGYGIAWRVLDAQHFGVPQRRRRVVIVGCLGDDGRASAEVLALAESVRRDLATSKQAREEAAGATRGSVAGGSGRGLTERERDRSCDLVGRLHDRADTRCVCGNEATDDAGEEPHGSGADQWRAVVNIAGALTRGDHTGGAGTVNGQDAYTGQLVVRKVQDDVIAVLGDKSHALTAEGHDASEDGTGRGTPVIAFYSTGGGNDAPAEEISPALKVGSGLDIASPPAVFASTVRRLTPMECERLQGFPDGWTAERYDYKKETVTPQADSARYKQMGNAVAVPVFEWVIARLVAVANAEALPDHGEGVA